MTESFPQQAHVPYGAWVHSSRGVQLDNGSRLRAGEGRSSSAVDEELALAQKIERILESKIHARK